MSCLSYTVVIFPLGLTKIHKDRSEKNVRFVLQRIHNPAAASSYCSSESNIVSNAFVLYIGTNNFKESCCKVCKTIHV